MRWLLRLLLTEADRRAIESDLAELYAFRVKRDGERAAARWLARQRLVYPLHLVAERLRSAGAGAGETVAHLTRDLAYGARSLVRAPVLLLAVAITLGVGLGTTAAMIAVVRTVLVAPLPYADAGAIYWIYTDNPPFRFRFSVVDYRALEADHPAFSAVAAYQTLRVTVSDGVTAERVMLRSVTGSYFGLLRQRPALGRLFDPSDDGRGEQLIVLSHAYWTERFGRDPRVIGRVVAIDESPHTVVGVLEAANGPLEREIAFFTPANWPEPRRRGPFFTTALGRLRPDVSREAAAATLRATNGRLFPLWKSSYQDEKATWSLLPFKERVVGDTGRPILLVLAAVASVLLIAGANTTNLLVARVIARTREFAIRGALGASRGRLLQQVLVEASLLTAGAVAVGVGVAAGCISLVRTYGNDYIPRLNELTFAGTAVGAIAVCGAACALLIGLVSAAQGLRPRLDASLAAGARAADRGPAAGRVRRVLVAAEFALATPLLIAAVLVLASLYRLAHVDVGLDHERLLTAELSLVGTRYANQDDRRAFWRRAVERLEALPGVEAVALVDSRPPGEGFNQNNFNLEDRPTPEGQNQPVCTWVAASPGYFRAAGLSVMRGRLYEERDLRPDAPVIVVDRAWAQRFFPGEDVVGRRLREGGCTDCPWTTVLGVVETVKYTGLESDDHGTVYYPFVNFPGGYFVLRAAGDPAALAGAVRRAVHELDPALATSELATGPQLVAASLAAPAYLSLIVSIVAVAAIIVSTVGIYGIMSYFLQQQAREVGIRLALGGHPAAIRRRFILHGVWMVALGIGVGVLGAVAASRLIGSVLFGISATNLLVMAGVPAGLLLLAALAALPPARRAASLDPAVILREG